MLIFSLWWSQSSCSLPSSVVQNSVSLFCLRWFLFFNPSQVSVVLNFWTASSCIPLEVKGWVERSQYFFLLTVLQYLAVSILSFPISKLVPPVVGNTFCIILERKHGIIDTWHHLLLIIARINTSDYHSFPSECPSLQLLCFCSVFIVRCVHLDTFWILFYFTCFISFTHNSEF